jgi:GAF domain-containing protein/anti-sigma regulatory factor (Ser/Thr protein kinase)
VTAREQQAAAAEILRVIASSPTDVLPTFEAIASAATRLCAARDSLVIRFDGALMHLMANEGFTSEEQRALRAAFPRPADRTTVTGRALLTRAVAHVADVTQDPDYGAPTFRFLRAVLSVPMLHNGHPIGAINVTRREPEPFSPSQITLLETFARQAVIAIENVRLFTELEARNRDLTATGEILQVISSSPTDEKPVFDAIARSSVRLCDAVFSVVATFDGEMLHHVAHEHVGAEGVDALTAVYPLRPDRGQLAGRAILDRAVVHVPDVTLDPEYVGAALGNRATLSVPMIRQGMPIGTITIARLEPVPFTDQQIALLKTFADQAVIAIENVRLFKETKEALEQQTATAEILRIISQSPTDVQPVFDTIVRSAAVLCHAADVIIMNADGDSLRIGASIGPVAASVRQSPLLRGGGLPLTRGYVSGRAVVDRVTVHVHDVATASDDDLPEAKALQRAYGGHGTTLAVPLLREGIALGVITLVRDEIRPFTERQIALLETFADQAVVAIENVRLFTELSARNVELARALDQQTATGDILRVIAGAQRDVQPVFDAIVQNAVALCGASQGGVYRFDGEMIHSVSHAGYTPEQLRDWRSAFPRRVADAGPLSRAIVTRTADLIDDVEGEAGRGLSPETLANMRERGSRSVLTVPMLRDGDIIGLISLAHRDVNGFSGAQVDLLKTFADQAVIAIENARLFTELQARTQELTRSVGELTALGEVGRALSSTLNLETVLQTIVLRANGLAGTAGCTIWEYDAAREEFRLRASDYVDENDAAALQAVAPLTTTMRRGVGVTGQVMERRASVQIRDIAVSRADENDNPIRRRLIDAGHRALLAVPLLREDEVLGVLVVTRKAPGEFQPEVVHLLSTFATQSALAIQNARLFREIETKSRELEVASQHKSEFLASMSHELRTPLNAIIGFSDVLLQGMFGEMTDKQTEYLQDILSSGQHLLSLINDILDLSKIEAGRMELDVADFHLPSAIDDALLLMRERAGRRGLALDRQVDDRLGQIRGDQRKVKQVLLNLLSNAVKFTPEGGRIEVRAAPAGDAVEISVTDSGIGIAPEDHEAVFEEFRQVGKSEKKAEGTGLGLALCRKFVELHGGRIGVKSAPGQGSTFTFTLPAR